MWNMRPVILVSCIVSLKDQFDDPVYVHYDFKEFDYRIRQHLN
jgi:hypothetical protein